MKKYDVFDLTKFILSFFVVSLHSNWLILYPWLRIAVPMFFIIGSFLFFSRNADGNKLKKYVKRNLKLYTIWFVILLPFTILFRKEWFSVGVTRGLLIFIRDLIFGSTFRASWYIMASVIAVTIIFFMSKKINDKLLLLISFVFYLICSSFSNYLPFIDTTFMCHIFDYVDIFIGDIEKSFFMALIWVLIGRLFALNKINLSLKSSAVGLIISGVLLFFEHYFTFTYVGEPEDNSCYLMLIPFCIFLFALISKFDKVNIKCAKTLRICSTLIYVMHCAIVMIISVVIEYLSFSCPYFIIFVATSSVALVLSLIIIKLSSYKKLQFLSNLW